MVSTTRKTTNTEEKSVSFSRRPSNRIYVDEYESNERAEANEARVISVPKLDFSRSNTEIEYSKPKNENYSVPKMRVNAVPVKREREDLMPSIRSDKREAEVEVKKEKSEASFHSKVMLAVYVAVVMILAAVVIGTGYAITNTSNSVESLNNQLVIKNEMVMEYASRLELLDDPTYMGGKGLELDMEKTDSYIEVELVDELTVPVYNARTNLFDKICDLLGGLLG